MSDLQTQRGRNKLTWCPKIFTMLAFAALLLHSNVWRWNRTRYLRTTSPESKLYETRTQNPSHMAEAIYIFVGSYSVRVVIPPYSSVNFNRILADSHFFSLRSKMKPDALKGQFCGASYVVTRYMDCVIFVHFRGCTCEFPCPCANNKLTAFGHR